MPAPERETEAVDHLFQVVLEVVVLPGGLDPIEMTLPGAAVETPRVHVAFAQLRADDDVPSSGSLERTDHPVLPFGEFRASTYHLDGLGDEGSSPREVSGPVLDVGLPQRSALVQEPEQPFGQDIAELLHAGPLDAVEGVVRILHRYAGDRCGAQLFVTKEEEPVLVVDVGEERRRGRSGVHRERTSTHEHVLNPAGRAISVADDRIVGVSVDVQAHPGVPIGQRRGPLKIRWLRNHHVVIEENNALPAGCSCHQQSEVAFHADVAVANPRFFEQSAGPEVGQQTRREVIHVDGDYLRRRIRSETGHGFGRRVAATAQCNQRAFQLR
ncbi:hypothetical protein [Lentzea sp. NPDC060358]|uniref:hypothetical protein n=1 Tax=Lentzea sp. NPDC060358 TaxID=3347103 RepID=UPI00364B5B58